MITAKITKSQAFLLISLLHLAYLWLADYKADSPRGSVEFLPNGSN
jgi:hypothetical protein